MSPHCSEEPRQFISFILTTLHGSSVISVFFLVPLFLICFLLFVLYYFIFPVLLFLCGPITRFSCENEKKVFFLLVFLFCFFSLSRVRENESESERETGGEEREKQ